MTTTTPVSFFDQLHDGLISIDAKVAKLKELAGKNFIEEDGDQVADDGFEKVRNFENDIRSMHSEVTDLKQRVFNRHNDLDGIEHKLQDLSAHLNEFVVKNELLKYGYVPWVNKRPVEAEEEADEAAGDDVRFPVPDVVVEEPETSDIPDSGVKNEPKPAIRMTVSSPAPVPKKRLMTPKSVAFKDVDDDRKRKDVRSRHKLDLNFADSPKISFAAKAGRRFTILPPGLTLNGNHDETEVIVPRQKDKVPDTIRNNPFANETTTRFNIPILMQSYNHFEPGTPQQMASDSIVNEHETIEFTPGLTTRRPVAVRRCKDPIEEKKMMTTVTNSFKNLSFVGTPTQPIPSRKLIESVKAVKSHGKMKQVGDNLVPATPQMPVSNISPEAFKYFLRSKK